MSTTYTVTTSFSADTTAVASEVNQNFTDVLAALNSFDITNCTGTIALARISSLTSSQMSSAFFKDEDDMASDSATAVSSQQAIKAHVTASSTDGYTPTSYAAEESVTLPNGFIMKMGTSSSIATNASLTITFGTAFPTAVKNVQITAKHGTSARDSWGTSVTTVTTSSFVIWNNETAGPFYWFAVGY
jgi:hypothetical protein